MITKPTNNQHMFSKEIRRRGIIRQVGVVILVVCSIIAIWLTYVLTKAASPQPQGPDGQNVDPIRKDDKSVVDESAIVIPKPPTRRPMISIASLERMDDDDVTVQNWDAVLTLAQMSSEVYSEGRVKFAIETLGFDKGVKIDKGDRHSLVASNSKVLVVAFRGTETLSDLLLDLGVVPIQLGPDDDGCNCHAGFHLAYQSLYEDIVHEIDRQDGRNKQIIVTGHSLGGAMSVMFAYHAEMKDGMKIKSVVTFGQPLLANEAFARTLLQTFRGRHKRFVHRGDLISRVARPYFHSGARILLVENERPLFWEPAILTQAPADGAPKSGPSLTTDPAVETLTENEMQQVKEYTQTNPHSDRIPKRIKRRELRRQKAADADEHPAQVAAEAGMLGWISQGLEDHKMIYYIKCIEAIEVNAIE